MAAVVAYLRVSTRRQGQSGLGLEAQEAAIDAHARQTGARVIGRYTEVESGKRSDRPELARALAHARRAKATLCVAKLDRLSRNVAFLAALMESRADFVACDMPTASRFNVHIMAAVAEQEARAASVRTTEALAAAKARGTLLGSARPGHWQGREEARQAGLVKARTAAVRAIRENAAAFHADLAPVVAVAADLHDKGKSLRSIADSLNAEGHTTRRGRPWNAMQVSRILNRAAG